MLTTDEMIANPRNTVEILKKYDFVFQKRFGQNFLIDTFVLEKIIRSAGISKEDTVIEIIVTTPDKERIETSLKVKASDLELLQSLGGMMP